jgi:hypothetical protein
MQPSPAPGPGPGPAREPSDGRRRRPRSSLLTDRRPRPRRHHGRWRRSENLTSGPHRWEALVPPGCIVTLLRRTATHRSTLYTRDRSESDVRALCGTARQRFAGWKSEGRRFDPPLATSPWSCPRRERRNGCIRPPPRGWSPFLASLAPWHRPSPAAAGDHRLRHPRHRRTRSRDRGRGIAHRCAPAR